MHKLWAIALIGGTLPEEIAGSEGIFFTMAAARRNCRGELRNYSGTIIATRQPL